MDGLADWGKLCAGTSNFDRLGGGVRSTIREDLMNVLGLMRREYKDDERKGAGYFASIFVEIKYMNDLSVDQVLSGCGFPDVDVSVPFGLREDFKDLFEYVAKEAERVSKEGCWNPQEPDVVFRLAGVALADSMGRCVCRVCDGVKNVLVDGRLVPCKKCRGGGKQLADGKYYSTLLGVSPSKWSEKWSWRHVAVSNIFYEWEMMVERVARRELFSD